MSSSTAVQGRWTKTDLRVEVDCNAIGEAPIVTVALYSVDDRGRLKVLLHTGQSENLRDAFHALIADIDDDETWEWLA